MVCSASGSPRLSAANKEELFEIISILFLLLSIPPFSLNVPVFAIFTLVYPLTHLFFNINCHLTPSLKSMLPLICSSFPCPCPCLCPCPCPCALVWSDLLNRASCPAMKDVQCNQSILEERSLKKWEICQ